jgi:uncharacterized membrane protein YkvA (DUF1232 family)
MEETRPSFRSPGEERFYRRLRGRVTRWAQDRQITPERIEYLLAAPDLFILLSRLAMDTRVPAKAKAKIVGGILVGGILYFLSPVDLIPDFIGPLGFLDDVAVAAWIVHSLAAELNALDPSIITEHWEGEENVLQRVQEITSKTEEVLGKSFRLVASALHELRSSITRDLQEEAEPKPQTSLRDSEREQSAGTQDKHVVLR